MLAKKAFALFVITSVIGIILNYIFTEPSFRGAYFALSLIIIPIFFGLPNTFTVILLYSLKINRLLAYHIGYLFLEAIGLYSIDFVVNSVLGLIPADLKFVNDSGGTYRKVYYGESFELMYTILILIIILAILGRTKRKTSSNQPSTG